MSPRNYRTRSFFSLQNILKRIVIGVYTRMIVRKRQEVMFWVLYSFLITFILARATVYLFPNFFIPIVDEIHIHHYAYGFIILSIVGLAALKDLHHKKPRFIASCYGLGLGLALDEFGMWIYLSDDYWMRRSYDAIIIVTGFLFSFLYFGRFWNALLQRIQQLYIKRFRRNLSAKEVN